MHRYSHIFVLLSVTLVSKTSSDIATENLQNTKSVESFYKRQGGYQNNDHNNISPYQYEYNGYKSQYSNEASQNYHSTENTQDIKDSFSSTAAERQDVFGADMMSMFAIGLAGFAAGAATYALIQNANQESEFDSVKSRLSSLEADQTSMCTSLTSITTADSGLTSIGGGYTTDGTGEATYLTRLAAVANPTCS